MNQNWIESHNHKNKKSESFDGFQFRIKNKIIIIWFEFDSNQISNKKSEFPKQKTTKLNFQFVLIKNIDKF